MPFLRIHLGEAGSPAVAGLGRPHLGLCRLKVRLHLRLGLQKHIGGNGHGHSPLGVGFVPGRLQVTGQVRRQRR
ncbi:hypothetical protein SZ55_3209 [Pseudomonas sp. FeS53a]|nr:hypothetical protein SZ55_3209 [Pseudomonas sp. FeS53a]